MYTIGPNVTSRPTHPIYFFEEADLETEWDESLTHLHPPRNWTIRAIRCKLMVGLTLDQWPFINLIRMINSSQTRSYTLKTTSNSWVGLLGFDTLQSWPLWVSISPRAGSWILALWLCSKYSYTQSTRRIRFRFFHDNMILLKFSILYRQLAIGTQKSRLVMHTWNKSISALHISRGATLPFSVRQTIA